MHDKGRLCNLMFPASNKQNLFRRSSRTLESITKLDEFLARDTEGDFEALGTGTEVPKFLRAEGMVWKSALLSPNEVTRRGSQGIIPATGLTCYRRVARFCYR